MKTFNLFSTKEFNETAKALATVKQQRQVTIQTLASHAIYMQAYNGKADFANNLIRNVQKHFPRDVKHVTAFLLEHCENIRATVATDKDQTKAFQTKKGVKPFENIEDAEAAGMAAVADLPIWDTWAKAQREVSADAKELDFLKSFDAMLTKADKAGVKPDQAKQYAALQSFIDLIRAGTTLADIKAENEIKLAGMRTEIIREVNAEPTKRTGTHG